MGKSHSRVEKLVHQTKQIQTKLPDSCKVCIVRNLVPKDLEKDLLKVHSTANYKATKEYILEQASLKRHAHFDDKGKHDKPVFMEFDTLLAKVSALKDAPGVGDEKPHGHDYCEVGSHRQEEEAWTDHTSNTLDQFARELMALKANKRGKGGKGGKGEGFQGNCNYCGKYGHRLHECWVKDQEMNAKGGSWSNKGGGKRTNRSRITPQLSADEQRTLERRQCSLGIQGRSLESCCQRRCLGRGQGKGHPGKGRWNVMVRWSLPAGWFARRWSMANSILELLDTQAFPDGRQTTWIGITEQFWCPWRYWFRIGYPCGVF